MALPTKLVSWNYSLQNRITYTSLSQTMSEVMYLLKERLKSEGWTVKGSCDGTAGSPPNVPNMSGIDVWTSPASAATYSSSASAPMSWIVLTDANGYDICLSYNSTAADIYRIAVSFSGGYVLAATPTFQPTSTTEQVLNTFYTSTTQEAPTLLGRTGTTSPYLLVGDRLVSIWTRPDSKGFRVAVACQGAWRACFGVDMHAPVAYGPGVNVALSHAFYLNGLYTNWSSTNAGVALGTVTNSGANQFYNISRRFDLGGISMLLAHSMEVTRIDNATSSVFDMNELHGFAPELQGSVDYVMKRKGLVSITSSARGKVGNNIDWWCGRAPAVDGDTYGNREFIVINGDAGFVWPWDGTPSVPGTAVVMA